ncbi:glycosyl hydrolase 53 family protein [Thermocatellispora tengchongensis]|uniref:glycosyl hydrolase 53 family protein n=1 Tax=Thermocatellispora tengchongensis TaxID=1073253 RepID=UPI00362B70C1
MAETAHTPTADLVNGGFEADGPVGGKKITGWKVKGGPAGVAVAEPGRTGRYALALTGSRPYTAEVEQTVTVPDGYYTVSAWTRSGGGRQATYLSAGGPGSHDARTSLPVSSDWKQVVVRGVHVTKGRLTVRLHSRAPAGAWSSIDDVQLVPATGPYEFLKGGDITMLNWVEDSGGIYRDAKGRPRDPMDIMRDNGVNVVRLRLYNDTGPDHPRIGYPNDHLPEGYQDEEDMLDLARRAAAHDMQIQLTFHYSDYWTNGEIQDIPKDWRHVTELSEPEAIEALEKYVYDYTSRVLRRMKAQGTTPQFVSLGNEIQGGLLFPYGKSWGQDDAFAKLGRFLKAGYRAVKDVSPATQVIIHIHDAGDDDEYEWFFGELEKQGVPYDLIGSSYYPYWTKKDVATVLGFFDRVSARFGKKIMVMETGINWNPVTHDGIEGQLLDNGPVPYGETREGQRDFLYELFAGLKSVPDGKVIGDLYWDPVMIPADGVGWQVGAENVVSNTTLFDFDGRALPAMDAYRYN